MIKRFNAWAIDTRSEERHGFIGRYWWITEIPPHLEGCQIAMFKTRALAREGLPSVKRAFPNAAVIKVEVTIETQ